MFAIEAIGEQACQAPRNRRKQSTLTSHQYQTWCNVGDIPSGICFLVSLDKVLKDHGNLQSGIQLTPTLLLSVMEYADDATLPYEDVDASSRRLTHFAEKANEEASIEVSIPKTKGQHIIHNPLVSETTEDDIERFNFKFKFKCDRCDMTYPTQHGLFVHKGLWCKTRKMQRSPVAKVLWLIGLSKNVKG